MENFNYFKLLCFTWAAIGVLSRFLIMYLGKRWNQWELKHAYSSQKPKWINFLGLFAVIMILYAWGQVFTSNVKHAWIIAALVSLTLIKVSVLVFNYDKFRKFAVATLKDKSEFRKLNINVFTVSLVFILMGIFLYK